MASNLCSLKSLDSDSDESNSPSILEKRIDDFSVVPFKLQWSLGMSTQVPLLNLTTANRKVIAYGCSHVTILYDYQTTETIPLQGHRNAVKTLSTTCDGNWLLTADFEEDNVVVVWHTGSRVPTRTLFEPHGREGITAAGISPNGKYIVTVGNEKCQKVFVWQWTRGKESPDATTQLVETDGRVKQINFNEGCPDEFILTSDYRVLFFAWKDNALVYSGPEYEEKSGRYGIFNGTCFVPNMRRAVTATSKGIVLVWELLDNSVTDGYNITTGERIHNLKAVPLQKCNITTILSHHNMIITGNSIGRITFYDNELRLLYWCQNQGMDSIRSISFDRQPCLLDTISTVAESSLELGGTEESTVKITNGASSENERKVAEFHKELTIDIENIPRRLSKKKLSDAAGSEDKKSFYFATDATLQCDRFDIGNFVVNTSMGVIALIEVRKLKCHFISHPLGVITSIDAHPESKYIIVGSKQGLLFLYDYEKHSLVTSKATPPLPDFRPILAEQMRNDKVVYVTCIQTQESLTAISALRYSPRCDLLACAIENGAIWILHPTTLEPLDEIPYKHSSESILNIVFEKHAKYMAYSDSSMTVALFKRNDEANATPRLNTNVWHFLGKIRAHTSRIRDIIFSLPIPESTYPRFLSLGEDRDLIEYDVENSGPYPDPGLKILQVNRIESSAIPLSIILYPQFGLETFFAISNSEYKYRLLNDMTKAIRGTFLGPTFGTPVQHMKILRDDTQRTGGRAYILFVTDKEIGLQLLPFDGNPYKLTGIVAHPQKIGNVAVCASGAALFTTGHDDSSVLMWKIEYRSVDVLARLGGTGLSPYYCLIDGEKTGRLLKEMKDSFYYAQIVHQGENTTATRVVSDEVSTKQIPNLMRAIGYYPSNEELENILSEVAYKHYAESGQLLEEITFEEFVKLYVNHRPTFGISLEQIKNAFRALSGKDSVDDEDPSLSREEFLAVLFGRPGFGTTKRVNRGEPLTFQEAHKYLTTLASSADDIDEIRIDDQKRQKPKSVDFKFLPSVISYKDFATDIMGIIPQERRAEN